MKLVMVEWLDSGSHHSADWAPLDEITEHADILECRSVGWLVRESARTITLVPHMYGDDERLRRYGRGDMTIPRVAIRRIVSLSEGGRHRMSRR